MSKLAEFQVKVQQATTNDLLDSLILHAKKADENLEFYEVTKIIKAELLKRLK